MATGSSFKQSTSFTPEVVEELSRSNPGLLAWLRSTTGVFLQVALIFAYIFLETVAGILTSFVLKPTPPPKLKPMPSSIIVMNSGLSIVIGLLITAGTMVFSEKKSIAQAILNTFSAVLDWRAILSYSTCAAFFSTSGVFSMMAYSKLDAGLKKILDQLRLPLTAGMGAAIVGKRYSTHEWLALLIVPLAVCSFYFADVEHDAVTELHTKCRYPADCFSEPPFDICAIRVDGPTIVGAAIQDTHNINGTQHDIQTFAVKASNTDSAGLTFSLIATLLNCMGGLFQERLLKRSASTPFPIQKAQVELTGFPVAVAMSFILPLLIEGKGGKAIWWSTNEAEGSGEGFFQGYTGMTLIAISLDILLAWMGGFITKKFSALVQKISKCFILLLTVFCTGTFLKVCQADPLPMTMYSLAFVTASATVLFATMPAAGSTLPVAVPPARQSLVSDGPHASGALQLQEGGRQ